MKPLLLELQAFGPFAHRQVIDFRLLGAKTFFLIHDPTGAGKTSLLDGMCFALFGDSSGGERQGHQMRSHHADDDILTEVRYSFALGADTYRVRRVPDQMRKSRRGGGETKQQQIAELWRIETVDGIETERPLASGWIKVTEAVKRLLGFDSQQFRQVIMLPQGKFFEFLKSSSQDREKILQTLFGTELYKRIEEQLKHAANDLSRQAENVGIQRQTLLRQADAESLEAVQARRGQQTEELALRQAAEQAAAAAALGAEKALAEARGVAVRFQELDQAGSSLLSLRAQEAGWATQRDRLAQARRAATIEPHADAVADLDRQLAQAASLGQTLATQAAAALQAREKADAALAAERARSPELERAVTRVLELESLREKVAALDAARDSQAKAGADAARAGAALNAARQARDAAAQTLAKLNIDLQAQRLQAAAIEGLQAAQAQLSAQLGHARALEERLSEQADAVRLTEAATTRVNTASTRSAEARLQRDRLRQAWLAGQAARLALALAEGEPCPVCGGHEHPAPAHAAQALVSDDSLKAAEDAATQAETAQRAAEHALASAREAESLLKARIEDARRALGDAAQQAPGDSPNTAATLAAQARSVHDRLATAQAAARSVKDLESRLHGVTATADEAERATQTAETQAQAAQSALERLKGQLAEREAGVPAELSAPAALEAARKAAADARDRLTRSLEAATAAARTASEQHIEAATRLQAHEQARTALTAQRATREADLRTRLHDAGFADAGAFAAARLDERAIAKLAADIEAFAASLAAAVERALRAAEATRELTRPDLASRTEAHEAGKAAQQAAGNAVRDTMAALKATAGFADALQRMADEYRAIEDRYTVLKEVSDVAGGNNPQRMSLQRYVLATLLEEVLAATTLRLRVMSRGRYEMRRKLAATDQRAAAGLDLEVFDQYTGTTRAVSTLSGGESFLASLALALGLSDVVQSHAGGIHLDAIFVDEGFGTLDPEALASAIRSLQDLQQAGRMVGIISHVAELKEWIDARLELRSTPSGSVAEFRL